MASIVSTSVDEAIWSDFGEIERAAVGGEEEEGVKVMEGDRCKGGSVPPASAMVSWAVGVGREGDGEKEYRQRRRERQAIIIYHLSSYEGRL